MVAPIAEVRLVHQHNLSTRRRELTLRIGYVTPRRHKRQFQCCGQGVRCLARPEPAATVQDGDPQTKPPLGVSGGCVFVGVPALSAVIPVQGWASTATTISSPNPMACSASRLLISVRVRRKLCRLKRLTSKAPSDGHGDRNQQEDPDYRSCLLGACLQVHFSKSSPVVAATLAASQTSSPVTDRRPPAGRKTIKE